MNKKLRFDFYIVLGIILVSIPIIIPFQIRPLISAIFLFVLPTIYLFIRKKKPIKEIIFGTLITGGMLGFALDIILSANNAWNEVSSQLVFNYRLFGFLPLDEPIWFILWSMFIIVFYEHFYDKENKDKLSNKFLLIVIPTIILLFIICILAIKSIDSLTFPYAYFFAALPAVIPVAYVLIKKPGLIIKFLKTSFFFFMLCLVYELIAVKLGQWYFPGQYIGMVKIIGIEFPFEELFFWMTISTSVVLSIYEGFVDDGK